jgi:hypothetical protein
MSKVTAEQIENKLKTEFEPEFIRHIASVLAMSAQ